MDELLQEWGVGGLFGEGEGGGEEILRGVLVV